MAQRRLQSSAAGPDSCAENQIDQQIRAGGKCGCLASGRFLGQKFTDLSVLAFLAVTLPI